MDREVLRYLDQHEADLFVLLRELVEIQSNSHNKAGVDRVGERVSAALADTGLSRRKVPQAELGDHLLFSSPAAKRARRSILITGHMDTVFPEDTPFRDCREEDGRIHGPGVIDMKGGLVVTIFAVRALAAAGLIDEIPLILLFNSDEEIGSPTTIPLLAELAPGIGCGLVTECGGTGGEVVTGRRGKCGYRLLVRGRAGHAAFAGEDKASAILELAHKVIGLEGLNNTKRGLVVNVGMIKGGIGPNTVPEEATALVDTRFTSADDDRELAAAMESLMAQTTVPGTEADLEVTNRRPVMAVTSENRALFALFAETAADLGLVISEEFRSGVSDANSLAGLGIPVLDGLGPVGEFDHSDREYMIRRSLPERTRLLAEALPRVAARFCR